MTPIPERARKRRQLILQALEEAKECVLATPPHIDVEKVTVSLDRHDYRDAKFNLRDIEWMREENE